jgi:hypothetical protein
VVHFQNGAIALIAFKKLLKKSIPKKSSIFEDYSKNYNKKFFSGNNSVC